MTTTWLVGVDGSDNSLHAVEWTIDQAVGRDVRVVVVAAWSPPIMTGGGAPEGVALQYWDEFSQSAATIADTVVAERARDGVRLEARVVEGSPAQVLLDAGRDAELLVVGARGHGRVKGLVLGSVSQRCVTHGTVPTAIIPPAAPLGAVRRTVVGFDGSPNARHALQWSLRFFADDISITVVDALPVAPWLPPATVRRRFAEEVDAAQSEFEAHMVELDPGHRAEHSFVLGDARVKLTEAAHDADLVVLGARGRGGIGSLLLGSTTTWMLHNATRATVVVPATIGG